MKHFEATVNRMNHRRQEIIYLMHQKVGGVFFFRESSVSDLCGDRHWTLTCQGNRARVGRQSRRSETVYVSSPVVLGLYSVARSP